MPTPFVQLPPRRLATQPTTMPKCEVPCAYSYRRGSFHRPMPTLLHAMILLALIALWGLGIVSVAALAARAWDADAKQAQSYGEVVK
jgi:hypothetical protein